MAPIPYEATYHRLHNACASMVHRPTTTSAKELLESLVQSRLGVKTSNDLLLAHMIAEPLLRRLDHRVAKARNIYLQEFDIPQIELFYQMGTSYPQVVAAHLLANQFQAHVLAERSEASVLEIGIGKGTQLVQLLDSIAESDGALRHLRVIALDPDPTSLEDARDWLERNGERQGIRVSYTPICARFEDLDVDRLQRIRDLAGDSTLLVNAAFAFHHTTHPVGDQILRTEFLARIAAVLRPRLLTLVEPNADHDAEPLMTRVDACWRHFGTVFDLIDESGLAPEVCFSIKHKFFGREIEDIFGTSDVLRCERHETTDSWMRRLHKAGFTPYDGAVPLRVNLPSYCDVASEPGLVRLGYRGQVLIGVMAMQPRDGALP